jgi:hypothetical protein
MKEFVLWCKEVEENPNKLLSGILDEAIKGMITYAKPYFEIVFLKDDQEVLSWYRDIIGDRTYDQLKIDNDHFLQSLAKLLKKQAHELPTNSAYRKDYYKEYYPSIMDL